MELLRIIFTLEICLVIIIGTVSGAPSPQEPAFEVPVQLIGFPFIIAAVRVTNFVKKLAYSINPETYVSRSRRSTSFVGDLADEELPLDVIEVEKRLVKEFGKNVCIYEKVCSKHATKALQRQSGERVLDWDDVFSQYRSSPDRMKQNYLLSVFIGDIIASPKLCHRLSKRGKTCDETSTTE